MRRRVDAHAHERLAALQPVAGLHERLRLRAVDGDRRLGRWPEGRQVVGRLARAGERGGRGGQRAGEDRGGKDGGGLEHAFTIARPRPRTRTPKVAISVPPVFRPPRSPSCRVPCQLPPTPPPPPSPPRPSRPPSPSCSSTSGRRGARPAAR